MTVETLVAGREMDALIAERVMGWKRGKIGYPDDLSPVWFPPEQRGGWCEETPHYSTSLADAWLVVEKLNVFEAYSLYGSEERGWWIVPHAIEDEARVRAAQTPALAICLAALKAVGS